MPSQTYNVAAAASGNSTDPDSTNERGRGTSGEDPMRQNRDPARVPSKSIRSSDRIVGDYTLSKTLGAGSVGKVKLATHNVTGEKLAVKILPRIDPSVPNALNGSNAESVAEQASKDAQEIRALREANLSMLLHHPYICGMRELVIHEHHYYMVFEYVSGGQMLDYIITHGRLRERVARKFARQIGSALEYCHQNDVVHRDLKLENILISETGDIKIIDFGLSNVYDPDGHLSTLCGNHYIVAPELLKGTVYTGPEVDVWCFGVVLYVLVCGKVPFDGQNTPALHAKIKRGLLEYPIRLSAECKHLLSRMLVADPAARATLSEVICHPWMTHGFSGPPDSHLAHREPLRVDDLDTQVIRGMNGFEFGTEEEIEKRLVAVLESENYVRAVQAWERKRLAVSYESDSQQDLNKLGPPMPAKPDSRRFSGFDFFRRKSFSPTFSPWASPTSYPSHTSLTDTNLEPTDPTKGFHPLISMYYLAREKMERDRVYGPGQFANAQLSPLDADVSVATEKSKEASATATAAAADTHLGGPSAYASTTMKPPPAYTEKDPPRASLSLLQRFWSERREWLHAIASNEPRTYTNALSRFLIHKPHDRATEKI